MLNVQVELLELILKSGLNKGDVRKCVCLQQLVAQKRGSANFFSTYWNMCRFLGVFSNAMLSRRCGIFCGMPTLRATDGEGMSLFVMKSVKKVSIREEVLIEKFNWRETLERTER